ncbi:hypothetical protein GCM10009559_23060 [Pseudonocardia zijingensis]|uniref:Uncharacterized protein n=1 Tax=Pseudonocardia zijingensis TaxID=153376 RepID=A0ABP4ACS3_9PSEU
MRLLATDDRARPQALDYTVRVLRVARWSVKAVAWVTQSGAAARRPACTWAAREEGSRVAEVAYAAPRTRSLNAGDGLDVAAGRGL